MSIEIVCVHQGRNILGEGPIWNERDQSLYWTDIFEPAIYRYDVQREAVFRRQMPEPVGSLVFRGDNTIVAGTQSGFAFIDFDQPSFRLIHPVKDSESGRLNDGKVDGKGRYWCGSINLDLKTPSAHLYCLDGELNVSIKESGIIAANGIAFSPGNDVLYLSDSRRQVVWAYDFDLESGTIDGRREFVSTVGQPARVDGATVDRFGNYWCALIYDWHIACYSPAGEMLRRIRLPVQHPTMCTFGGRNLDVLFVTSGSRFLRPGDSERQPLAGALFAIHGLGPLGIVEPRFAA